jgi:tripartite-type tricarboxylate transporter receptor subunit TctC
VSGLPGLRSLAVEAGSPALNDVSTWIGVVAPAGTPRAIIDKVSGEIARVYADPAMMERLQKAGINAVASTPEDLARFIQSETTRWSRVVKESGIELN